VFSRATALTRGVTARQFRTSVEHGDFVRFHGAWILADSARTLRASVQAALLHAGANAALTASPALVIHGLEIETGPVVLSVPEGAHRSIEGVVLLRDRKRPAVLHNVADLPIVPRERCVIDAIRLLGTEEGRAVVHEALRLGWTTSDRIEAWCERLKGHRGLPRLREQARYATSGTRAESERILYGLMQQAQLDGWRFNSEIRDGAGKLLGIADCANESLKLLVELDGMAWHTKDERFVRDRVRQNDFVAEGWTPLRFTYPQLINDPADVMARIRRETLKRTRARPPLAG
jgi:very-short-patch-repair endonuclease